MEAEDQREWYYAAGTERKGPYLRSDMAAFVRSGTIDGQTLVWKPGFPDWQAASLTELGALLSNQPPPPPSSPARTASPDVYSAYPAEGPVAPPREFMDAVRVCFQKYAGFSGRASRSEYWYFVLFGFLVSLVLGVVDVAIIGASEVQPLGTLFSLAILLPSLAVGVRRLHDIGRTGWWLLIGLIPIVGFIVLIVFFCQRGRPDSRFPL